jgi:uncharacterized membrane protein YbhN (UPF0104 family)
VTVPSSTDERAYFGRVEQSQAPVEKKVTPILATVTGALRGWSWIIRRWSTPLRTVVTVILLTVVLLRINLSDLQNAIEHANVGLLLAMLGCSYLSWVLNTYRWQRILAGFRVHCGFGTLLRLNLASLFYGLALPGQVSGEVLKGFRLARRVKQPQAVYVSIFLDRIYGLIGLTIIGLVGLALAPPPADWVGRGPSWVVLATAMLLAFGVIALPWISRLPIPPILYRYPVLTRLASRLANSTTVHGVTPPPTLLAAGCALGLIAQEVTVLTFWGVSVALGLHVSPLAVTWIAAVQALAAMLPITLMNFGLREITFIGLLGLFGVASGQALTLALTMFAIGLALGLTGGALDLLIRDAPPTELVHRG